MKVPNDSALEPLYWFVTILGTVTALFAAGCIGWILHG